MTDKQEYHNDFYIVGIGASAGGLEALEKFFSYMPPDSGMAFIVVQHLSPDYRSMMVEILSKHTEMKVLQVEDGMPVMPNQIYLIPRKKNMNIFHGKLFLKEKDLTRGLNLPIDIFFISLAQDQADKAIAIILSGTGSDGTRGIRAIKENDGMVMVQQPNSAKFDGMPNSAISTHLVDYVLSPEKMPAELLRFIQHPHIAQNPETNVVTKSDEDGVSKILAEIRTQQDVDFTDYKQTTVIRRIQRRMGINQIDKIADYVRYVHQNPQELNTLYKELLIGVTKFFRDTEAFESLAKHLLPKIFEQKGKRNTIRIWVAACSTGEEAYSVAMLFAEYLETTQQMADIKVFATDIDKNAIEYASLGMYPDSIAADVSLERLHRFFVKKDDKYQINREIRQMVIFAKHNVVKDPPFAKISLITCRNLMIYLQPQLQERLLTFFHFSLKPNGFLFLGNSESIGDNTYLFSTVENKYRIYQYKAGYKPLTTDIPLRNDKLPETPLAITAKYATSKASSPRKLSEMIYQALVEEFISPFIIINENHQVVHTSGKVEPYLKIPHGEMSFDLAKMLREDFAIILRTAVHSVMKNQKKLVYTVNLKETQEGNKNLNLHVTPLFHSPEEPQLIAIIFEEVKKVATTAIESIDMEGNFSQHIIDLEQELQYTRESLQAAIEELETSNEELQATNEELLAANEELQSTNEELQSVNEELMTVNSEYQYKIEELTDVNNDINNLLSSTHIGTVFLDEKLCIKRFTPDIMSEIYLMASDIGRPIQHISHNLKYHYLLDDIDAVVQNNSSKEMEVENKQGQWYLLRILPYLTVDKIAQGVVITLVNITERRRSEESRYLLAAIAESLEEAIIGSNLDGIIMSWNQGAENLFGYSSQDIQNQSISLIIPTEQQAEMRDVLAKVKKGQKFERFKTIRQHKNGQNFTVSLTLAAIKDANDNMIGFYQVIHQ